MIQWGNDKKLKQEQLRAISMRDNLEQCTFQPFLNPKSLKMATKKEDIITKVLNTFELKNEKLLPSELNINTPNVSGIYVPNKVKNLMIDHYSNEFFPPATALDGSINKEAKKLTSSNNVKTPRSKVKSLDMRFKN